VVLKVINFFPKINVHVSNNIIAILDTYFRDYGKVMQTVPVLCLPEADFLLVVVRCSSFFARYVFEYCSLSDYVSYRRPSSSFLPVFSVC